MMVLEIQHHAGGPVMKNHEFAGHGLFESVDACDSVADLKDVTDRLELDPGLVFSDLFFDDLRDFFGFKHRDLPY